MKINKDKIWLRLVNFSGVVCLIAAALLVLWTLLAKLTFFRDSYAMIIKELGTLQQYVVDLEYKWLIVIVIELLFASKILLPIPLSAVFMISGMVFPFRAAVIINGVGMVILMTVKYLWGRKFGGGNMLKLMRKSDLCRRILDNRPAVSDAITLFVCRLVPSFPVNSVSQIYGSIKFNYVEYIGISVLGFVPKIMSYSVAGRNVYDPFSFGFTTPLIVIFTISGLSIMCTVAILKGYLNTKTDG